MKRLSIASAALAALIALALGAPAQGYGTHGRFPGNSIRMRASGVSFPAGSPYRAALGTVESRFYLNPSAAWIWHTYDEGSVGLYNFENETWFTSNLEAPATTFWWTNIFTGQLIEADVVFNNTEAYTTSMSRSSLWPYGGPYRPFEATALHEYGHVAGLSHEDGEYNIMGQDWTHIHSNGASCRSYIGEDASDGLVALYGPAGVGFEDVSATLFKWVGASGEYSSHGPCVMLSASGALLPSTSFSGQRRYEVARGQPVQVELTYENSGETTQAPQVGLYISTNSTISTADRLIASYNLTLGRADVYTTRLGATIPADLVPGQTYWLGTIVDPANAIGEVDEGNNAAYHLVLVR